MCFSLSCSAIAASIQYPSGPAVPFNATTIAEPVMPLFGLVLLALTIALILPVWRISGLIDGTRRIEPKPVAWGLAHVALVVAWVVAFSLGWSFLAAKGETEPDLISLLGRSALLLGTTALLIGGIAQVFDPEGVRALGLRSGKIARSVLGAWCLYVGVLPGWIGLGLFSRWLLERAGIRSEMQVVITKFLDLDRSDVPLALVLGIGVLPFFEELAFRGFLQPVLVKTLGPARGVVVTSLVFGGLHGPGAFLPIFGLSLVLGAVMLRSQRLLASWAVHALHNGLMFAVLTFLRAHPDLVPKDALLAFL